MHCPEPETANAPRIMSPANRIILNTLATYGGSVITLVLGLLSVRWTLEALGHTDFGLFGLVGSLILLLSILNGGLSVGVVRFYSYAIGHGSNLTATEAGTDLNKWFNTALSIHLLLPLVLIAIGWPLGEYAIRHWLTIPADRVESSVLVFRISLLAAFATVAAVPYISMFHAQQRMVEPAIVGVIQSIAVFALAWSLLHVDSDRLVFYAAFMMLITLAAIMFRVARATWLFPACRPRLADFYHRDYLRSLFSFVGWKMFGIGCVTLREQGTPILANLAFGPIVNAAYSVARGLSHHAASLSSSLISAFQPALTGTEGKGDRQGMLKMAIQVCNFGTLLVALFAVPVMIEMDAVLALWLIDPPPYASDIGRWMIAMLIVDKMTAGPMIGVNARGKIALYEAIQGPLLLLALPLMWAMFAFDLGPVAIGIALFSSHLAYSFGRVIFAKFLIGFPVSLWLRETVFPLVSILLLGLLIGLSVSVLLEEGLLRILVTTVMTGTAISALGWLWVLNGAERRHAIGLALVLANRFRPSHFAG